MSNEAQANGGKPITPDGDVKMKIININPELGDAVKFDSVEEMASALKNCGSVELSEAAENLRENVDYEIIEE